MRKAKLNFMKVKLLFLFIIFNFTLKAQVINTIAGTGVPFYNGDSISATSAQINQTGAVAVDDSGNIYIPDYGNNRIRKIDEIGRASCRERV